MYWLDTGVKLRYISWSQWSSTNAMLWILKPLTIRKFLKLERIPAPRSTLLFIQLLHAPVGSGFPAPFVQLQPQMTQAWHLGLGFFPSLKHRPSGEFLSALEEGLCWPFCCSVATSAGYWGPAVLWGKSSQKTSGWRIVRRRGFST